MVYILKLVQLDSDLTVPEIPLRLALHGLLLEIVPLVIEFFASGQADLYFDAAVFEVDLKRHEGVALGLYLSRQFHDLALMQQEPSSSQGLAVENIALFIRADIHTVHKSFAVVDRDISFLDTALALTDGFHLCAEQLDPCLIFFLYKIIMVGFLVVCYQFDRILAAHFLPFLPFPFLLPVCLPALPDSTLPVRSIKGLSLRGLPTFFFRPPFV